MRLMLMASEQLKLTWKSAAWPNGERRGKNSRHMSVQVKVRSLQIKNKAMMFNQSGGTGQSHPKPKMKKRANQVVKVPG
jgi:hypothetical protein